MNQIKFFVTILILLGIGYQDAYATDYCLSDPSGLFAPNYKNFGVQKAAQKLSQIRHDLNHGDSKDQNFKNFEFYESSIGKLYAVRDQSKFPNKFTAHADRILITLCNEYIDWPEMIEAKLAWIARINLVSNEHRIKKINNESAVFSQFTEHDYFRLYHFKMQFFQRAWNNLSDEEKTIDLRDQKIIHLPQLLNDCLLKVYSTFHLNTGKKFHPRQSESLFQIYLDFYRTKCSEEEKHVFYVFRGDSNFKAFSGESNASLLLAQKMARLCGVKRGQHPDQRCALYYSRPSFYRHQFAKKVLSTWLLYDEKYAKKISDFENFSLHINVNEGEFLNQSPLSFYLGTKDQSFKSGLLFPLATHKLHLNSPDLGLSLLANNQGEFLKKLNTAVHRHVHWTNSGVFGKQATRKSFFSPFLANSTMIYSSDQYTAPGRTIGDGRTQFDQSFCHRHWMYIFRVHAKDILNKKRVSEANDHLSKIHLVDSWWDERSLGSSELSNYENGIAKAGSVQPYELAHILNLSNISSLSEKTYIGTLNHNENVRKFCLGK